MKVTIKNKHLLFIILALAGVLIIAITVIQPILINKSINKHIASGQLNEAKHLIINQINNSSDKWQLIKDFMIEPVNSYDQFDVYIGPSMSHYRTSSDQQLFTLDECEKYLSDYIAGAPADGYVVRAIEILVRHYENKGDFKRANETVALGLERDFQGSYHKKEIELMSIELQITNINYANAEQLINRLKSTANSEDTDTILQVAIFEAKVLVGKGEWENALSLITKTINDHQQWHEELLNDIKKETEYVNEWSGSPYFQELTKLHAQIERVANGNMGVVTGRIVRTNGEPVAYAGVYLREESDINYSIVNDTETYKSVTDADGRFSFQGVMPGNYQVHTGFTFEQIDGWSRQVEMDDWLEVKSGEESEYNIVLTPLIKQHSPVNNAVITDEEVTFAWEEYPNAASYSIFGTIEFDGGSYSHELFTQIAEPKLTVSVNELYSKGGGIVLVGEDSNLEPSSILSFANTEGLFSWYVHAYDKNGKFIGQSNGYRLQEKTMGDLPFFQIKERKLTEADQALLKGNIDVAKKLYKQAVQHDQNDIHSLRMITRLGSLDRDFTITKESLPLWIALAERDPYFNKYIEIANYFYKNEDWEQFNYWYNQLNPNEITPYEQLIKAKAFMKQWKLEEARDEFKHAFSHLSYRDHLGYLLAIELLLQNDWKHVPDAVHLYQQKGVNVTNWLDLSEKIVKQSSKEEVKTVLKMFIDGEKEQLKYQLTKMNDEALKKFLDYLIDLQ